MALNMSAAINIKANVDGEQSVDRLNSKLRDVGRQGEMSAKQIRQAYQTLPAQFQDIAVSLAGGQNPFMVLLQQGSQVTTQFGGIGNAIRGIAAVVTPAAAAVAAFAAAVGAVALAAYQGYEENKKLQVALLTTGNFAGMTADSFDRAAARIQAASGATASAAREMLMGAAGSGAFGPGSIDAATQAMVRLQRLTGQSSEEVVKLFSGMSKGVANWAAETNRSYNFLNVEQYKYIRQLEEQGRQEQAMAVASSALNDALKTRTIELGYLERGWKAVKEGASNAWNAMLNIGRPDTMADQIAAIEARLRNSEALREGMRKRGQPVPDKSPEILALEAELEALREVARLQQRAAEGTANRARVNQEAIAAERKAEEDRKRAASEAESLEKQRLGVIQGLRDEVTKLTEGEDELVLTRLRSMKATEQEIKTATALIEQRRAAAAGAEKNKELERQQEEAAKTLARQEEERKQVLKGLNDQVLTMTMGEDELVLARLRSVKATDDEIAAAQRLQGTLAKLREEKKQEAEAKSIFEATRTPAEKLNIELARLNALLDSGKINWDTYSRAVFKAQDEFDDLGKKGKDSMDEIARAIDGWGKQAADAFVQFAFTGKATFKDFVNSVLQDIARMMVYENVTKPLFAAVSSMFPFANGGVMTSGGPLPLNGYSRGGIANSPQLALFGEGRMPEAYVPLPDGRSIPVTMQGGSGETNVVVNVNMETGQEQVQSREGAGALGKAIAAAVRTELINQRRPGGLLAA